MTHSFVKQLLSTSTRAAHHFVQALSVLLDTDFSKHQRILETRVGGDDGFRLDSVSEARSRQILASPKHGTWDTLPESSELQVNWYRGSNLDPAWRGCYFFRGRPEGKIIMNLTSCPSVVRSEVQGRRRGLVELMRDTQLKDLDVQSSQGSQGPCW